MLKAILATYSVLPEIFFATIDFVAEDLLTHAAISISGQIVMSAAWRVLREVIWHSQSSGP